MAFIRENIVFGDERYRCVTLSDTGLSGMNGVSKSIQKFKAGVAFHIATWAEVAKVALLEAGLQREDILVRALGHQQTAVLWRSEPKPMDVLCRYIAKQTGCAYVGDLLRKKRKNAKLTGLN